MTHRTILIPMLLLLAGCSSHRHDRPGSTSRPAEAAKFNDVARDAIRERAMRVLTQAAMSTDPRIRANAMEASGYCADRCQDLLRAGLSDANLAVRTVAALTIGKQRVTPLVPETRPLLRDTSPYVQAAAIYALIRCGESVDRSPLGPIVTDDPSLRVRANAAWVLGELGDRSALPLLRNASANRPARSSQTEFNLFQLQVAEAMIKLGDEQQLEPVRAALYPARPEDLELTALAVQILGEVKDRGSADQLMYLSATKDQAGQRLPAEVRLAIASAMAKMGWPQGDFIADEFIREHAPTIRSQAASVYGETGTPDNLGILDGVLEDSDWGVRVAASGAVLRITERSVVGASAAQPW